MDRPQALELIRNNIAKHGQHLYLVSGTATPRFAYTIGLRESVGFELVLPGAVVYLAEDVYDILNELCDLFRAGASPDDAIDLGARGTFHFGAVRDDWASELILGVVDYYQLRTARAYQVLPDEEHHTIDIPDLSQPFEASPSWRWSREPWPFSVPEEADVMVDGGALHGRPVRMAVRWEQDYWELYADPDEDLDRDATRFVPLAVVLGADPSLVEITTLGLGDSLWRDGGDAPWRRRVKSTPSE